MIWLKRVCWLLLTVSLLLVGLSFYVTEQIMRPGFYEHRSPEQGLRPIEGLVDPLQSFGLDFETVEFPAVDGKILRGWFIPAGDESQSVIVTVHGGGTDRRSYLSFAPVLNKAGYPVLMFDNREHGISDGSGLGMSIGMREAEDVVSAIDYLESRGFFRFSVLGNSQGGTSAIVAAAADERISAVVAQGTGTDLEDMMMANPILQSFPRTLLSLIGMHFYFRQDADWQTIQQVGVWPIDVIDEISPRPLFIIQGEKDRMAPLTLAEKNFAAAKEPKSMWVVPDGEHRGLRGFAGQEFDDRVLSFLAQYMPVSNKE
jgi:pimeloyl-ACP methyl ester carboxylesterase